jgi:asparagine synthase (glutamine-hydrolysing)
VQAAAAGDAMSEGIVGVVDFVRGIDNSLKFAEQAGRFSNPATGKGLYSSSSSDHCLLGMQRTVNDANQQSNVAFRQDLSARAAIHGEIHNFTELTAVTPGGDDLDLILSLYHREGPGFARKLNGLFSLAIIDENEKVCFILNDRFGMARQIYWTVIGGRLYFATHLKTLLGISGVSREVDDEALNIFLKYAYITSPWTIFKGIQKLPPGHMLTFRNGSADVVPYWGFDDARTRVADMQEAVDTYRSLLRKSIARRLGNADRTGILLSGGLDSSANVALAAECTDTRIKTFSIGFEDPRFDERPFARIVASQFNTQHHEFTITGNEIEDLPKLIWNIEEPYFEFGLFLTYCGLASSCGEVDAVIGGEGADQMFGTGGFAGAKPAAAQYLLRATGLMGPARALGRLFKGPYFYDHDNLAFKVRLFWNRATTLNDWYFYGYDGDELARLYTDPGKAGIPGIFDGQSVDSSSFESLYRDTQITQDIRHYVNENVMVKSGRMADMLGLTLRESFLDTEVADFLVGLEFPYKRQGSLLDHLRGRFKTKFLHRKAMEGILPKEIMTKPKQGGFVPVMLFLNDAALRKRIYRRLLASDAIRERFRTDVLTRIFEDYEAQQGRNVYWANFLNSKANRILFLLSYDIWHHYYVANDPSTTQPVPLSEFLSL